MGKKILVFCMIVMLAPNLFADTSYLRTLVEQPTTTFGDGVYMITYFLGRGADYPDFEAQKNFLREQGVLTGKLAQKIKDEKLRRQDLADLVVKTLGIKGGIFLRLAAPWRRNGGAVGGAMFRRYASNEAVFLKLMKAGDMGGVVTGEELISVVSRMTEYRATA